MENTNRLGMPYLLPSQAQKHVTHNEAIRMLDALVQPSVEDLPQDSPPATPVEGMVYAVSTSPTDEWAGKPHTLAAFQDGAWFFFTPKEGWRFSVKGETRQIHFISGAWDVIESGSIDTVPALGINTSADTTNRLTVSAPATLLSHEGTDHQLKINKALEGDTASVMFQSGFSGRAEIGLVGNDNFAFKTSTDGASFMEPITIDAVSGTVQSGDFGINRAPNTNLHVYAPDVTATIRIQSGDTGAFGSPFADFSHDGSSFFFTNWAQGNIAFTAIRPGTSVTFGAAGAPRVMVEETSLSPTQDNSITLGKSTNRWAEVWATNGVMQTSDARDKSVLGPIKKAGILLDAIEPKQFYWKDDEQDTVTNAGFVAQEIGAALQAEGLEFGCWGLSEPSDPQSRQWIKPDQLVAILWQALRETRAELKALQNDLK